MTVFGGLLRIEIDLVSSSISKVFAQQGVQWPESLRANIIGVNESTIEWCPNENPPYRLEQLVWWWVVRPDLGAAIAKEAPQELKNIISQYILQSWQKLSLVCAC